MSSSRQAAPTTCVPRYALTYLLLIAFRTQRCLKWGVPAVVLAVPYLYDAAICTTVINDGGRGRLTCKSCRSSGTTSSSSGPGPSASSAISVAARATCQGL